jgi:hypothetical protein
VELCRRGIVLRCWLGWLSLLKLCVLAALPTFLQWLLYGVQMDIFVGENSAVGLCGEEVHAVGNNVVERNLITILLDLLQDSSAQWFVGRRFQHGEKNKFVELFFSQLFEFEHLQSRFASIHQMYELFPFVLSETYAVVTVSKYVRFF